MTGKSTIRSHQARRDTIIFARKHLAVVRKAGNGFERSVLDGLDALLTSTDLVQLADRVLPIEGATRRKVHGDKYLDISKLALRDVQRARRIGLASGPPLSVLDIGAGIGTFCWVAQQLGHQAIAIEPPARKDGAVDFSAMMRALKVSQSCQVILPQTPIHRDDILRPAMRFDVATAFYVMFDMTEDANGLRLYWSADDYLFFLNDIRVNFLQPGGRLILRFNEHARFPLASASISAHYEALRHLLEPFMVSSDHTIGITLDLFRADGWAAAKTGTLSYRPTEDTAARKLRKKMQRQQRASARGLGIDL